MNSEWQLKTTKNRLSEPVDVPVQNSVQVITHHGKPAPQMPTNKGAPSQKCIQQWVDEHHCIVEEFGIFGEEFRPW